MIINLAKIRFGGTGGGTPAKPEDFFEETYVANGDYDVVPEEGHVFSGGTITVAVPSDQKPEDEFTELYEANGVYDITPESGHVFSAGQIEVDVHPTDKLTRTYTENDTYEISGEWTDAEITVNVPGPVEETFDITPTNSNITVVPTVADNVFSGGIVRGYDVDPVYNALDDLNTGDPVVPSALNFSVIGWNQAESATINDDLNAKIAYSKTKYDEWDPSRTDASYLYYNDTQMVFVPKIDTSNVTNMNYMFYDCSSLQNVPQLDTSNVTDMNWMFYGCKSLASIPQLDTSNVTDMSRMFRNCSQLTSIPQLDTSSVTSMSEMFGYCSQLTSIPQLDTSSVTDMSDMFNGCTSLTSIPQLDFSSATTIYQIFEGCQSLRNVSVMNTSNVLNMSRIFGTSTLERVEGIDFSSATDLSMIFSSSPQSRCARFIVNGKINVSCSGSWGFAPLVAIDFESVKSILEAANRTDNTDAKTLTFNREMVDSDGELAELVASCTSKGWTIEGLTLKLRPDIILTSPSSISYQDYMTDGWTMEIDSVVDWIAYGVEDYHTPYEPVARLEFYDSTTGELISKGSPSWGAYSPTEGSTGITTLTTTSSKPYFEPDPNYIVKYVISLARTSDYQATDIRITITD